MHADSTPTACPPRHAALELRHPRRLSLQLRIDLALGGAGGRGRPLLALPRHEGHVQGDLGAGWWAAQGWGSSRVPGMRGRQLSSSRSCSVLAYSSQLHPSRRHEFYTTQPAPSACQRPTVPPHLAPLVAAEQTLLGGQALRLAAGAAPPRQAVPDRVLQRTDVLLLRVKSVGDSRQCLRCGCCSGSLDGGQDQCPTDSRVGAGCGAPTHLGAGALPQEAGHLLADDLARCIAGGILQRGGVR